jgi:flagellar protein FlgJ
MNSILGAHTSGLSTSASPESLLARARSGDAQSIERVAAEFESLFVSLVLKEMRQTLDPGTLFGSDQSDVYGGMFDNSLSKHIVDCGGFGVADMVRKNLQRRPAPSSSATDTPAQTPILPQL